LDGGVAIFAGTKVKITAEQLALINEANPEANLESKEIYRADALQSLNGLHFRQDSTTGELVVNRSTREVKLNAELH